MTKLIALIVEDDGVFALPAWHRTIALMERRGLLVTHVALVTPEATPTGALGKVWYSQVFGLRHALRQSLFGALEKRRRRNEPRTWDEMAQTHGLLVRRIDNPNSAEMKQFLRSSRCDVLHVLAAVTLSPDVLDIPRSGVIAHQASLLPGGRGLFPYFWARLEGERVGQSFHQLSAAEPLGGPILAQREANSRGTASMLAFQVWTARRYPELALDATQRLLAHRTVPSIAGVEASYHSLPTRAHRRKFAVRGGCLSTWGDLRLTLSQRDKVAALNVPEEPLPVGGGSEPRNTSYKFPDVLPFHAGSAPGVGGKLIPMQPRRRASEA